MSECTSERGLKLADLEGLLHREVPTEVEEMRLLALRAGFAAPSRKRIESRILTGMAGPTEDVIAVLVAVEPGLVIYRLVWCKGYGLFCASSNSPSSNSQRCLTARDYHDPNLTIFIDEVGSASVSLNMSREFGVHWEISAGSWQELGPWLKKWLSF